MAMLGGEQSERLNRERRERAQRREFRLAFIEVNGDGARDDEYEVLE